MIGVRDSGHSDPCAWAFRGSTRLADNFHDVRAALVAARLLHTSIDTLPFLSDYIMPPAAIPQQQGMTVWQKCTS